MFKINVGVHCPNPSDVTSLYRGIGPLAEVRKIAIGAPIDFNVFQNMTWVTCKTNDVLFLQRPYTQANLEMVLMAKKNKKPVWVDYDDFLMDIPEDNPAYSVYMNEQTHRNIARILHHADLVTVTTRALKALCEQEITPPSGEPFSMGKNVIVIPNGYDYFFHGDPMKNSGNKLITWRGSDTHDRDLHTYADAIIEFMKQNPDWKIEFIGYKPWRIMDSIGKQAIYKEALDPFYYMDYLKKRAPSVHIVPLNDSIFNRCKSNIAWIEATVAGAAVIAPDWEQWRNPGAITYSSNADFFSALGWCRDNLQNLERNRKDSLECILKKFYLTKENYIRKDLIEALATGKPLPFNKGKTKPEELAELFQQQEGMTLE